MIDGEELSFTGKLVPRDFAVRPGVHEVQAIKSGKPSQDEVVTISRGGKTHHQRCARLPAEVRHCARRCRAQA